jgi:hypothetical protein
MDRKSSHVFPLRMDLPAWQMIERQRSLSCYRIFRNLYPLSKALL